MFSCVLGRFAGKLLQKLQILRIDDAVGLEFHEIVL